jgi:hypothetical protein
MQVFIHEYVTDIKGDELSKVENYAKLSIKHSHHINILRDFDFKRFLRNEMVLWSILLSGTGCRSDSRY